MNDPSMIEAVTGWILRSSLEAAVLVVLLYLVLGGLRDRISPGWRHAIWALVAVRLLVPVFPESAFSIFNAARMLDSDSAMAPLERTSSGVGTAGSMAYEGSNPKGERAGHLGTGLPAEHSTGMEVVPFFQTLLGIVWLIGMAVLAVRLACGYLRMCHRLRAARTCTHPKALRALEDARCAFRIRDRVPLIETDCISGPGLLGWFRPRLLIPDDLTDAFTEDELRLMFLHEMAHLKRADMPVNWILTALQILHWFNPLVWFAFRKMRAEREQACDAMALSVCRAGERRSYGHALLRLFERFGNAKAADGVVAILGDRVEIRRRVESIARFRPAGKRVHFAGLLVAVLAAGCLTNAERGERQAAAAAQSDSADLSETAESDDMKEEPQSEMDLKQLRQIPELLTHNTYRLEVFDRVKMRLEDESLNTAEQLSVVSSLDRLVQLAIGRVRESPGLPGGTEDAEASAEPLFPTWQEAGRQAATAWQPLVARHEALGREIAELRQRFPAGHPEAEAARNKLAKVEEQLEQVLKLAMTRFDQAHRDVLEEREKLLKLHGRYVEAMTKAKREARE